MTALLDGIHFVSWCGIGFIFSLCIAWILAIFDHHRAANVVLTIGVALLGLAAWKVLS